MLDLAVVLRRGGALLRFALADLLLEVLSSARRSSALVSCSCRSNSTMRSPRCTALPGRTSRVMTRDIVFGPASRGAEIVVDWTASTVPLRRTDRTKSRRETVILSCRSPGSTVPSLGVDRRGPAAGCEHQRTRDRRSKTEKRRGGPGPPAPVYKNHGGAPFPVSDGQVPRLVGFAVRPAATGGVCI